MEELDCSPKLDDDTTTTTTTANVSRSSTTTSTSSGFEETSEDGSTSSSGRGSNGDYDVFPIMQLPTELRSRIFNLLPQRQVPCLRLVCRKWRREVDDFYEFLLNIYDTTTNFGAIRKLRCRECSIWKLTTKLESHIFTHPAYLKVIKIFGPVSPENMALIITASTNLERLTLTRRANYPWYLNLQDTPGLKGLGELRYLRLNSEEHVSLHIRPKNECTTSTPSLPPPPMMDCYFPKLRDFEILKRFAAWQYSHYVTSILKFVARHSKTLRNIELDLIPLSCIALLDDDSSSGGDDSESDSDDQEPRRIIHLARKNSMISISPEQVQLQDLRGLKLHKFCVTTKGSDCDVFLWKSILETQKELREFRFDWLCKDPRAEVRARVTGFPWIYFQPPIEQSAETLVHVELASLSMFSPAHPRRVAPFDLGIFRNCRSLKSLILRCRENHAKLAPAELVAEFGQSSGDEDQQQGVNNNFGGQGVDEVLLMINGSELPTTLEQLEIFRFPMLTSDLVAMVSPDRFPNIRKLFLHECGKTGRFGVNAEVLRTMARLKTLKFLEVIGFNDNGGERRAELEQVFQTIGIPYEGQDTWLEFSDGSSSAYASLKSLIPEEAEHSE